MRCFALTVAMLGLAASVEAQALPKVINCTTPIPAEYKPYKVWDSAHVNVRPVIPEFEKITDPQKMKEYVHHVIMGPNDQDVGVQREQIQTAHDRWFAILNIEAFVPPGTDLAIVKKQPLPAEFLADLEKATRPENLEYVKLPCNKTTLDYLSWSPEDGSVIVESEPQIIGWRFEGMVTDDAEHLPAVALIRTKDTIQIKSGINKDTFFRLVIPPCGNPTQQLVVVNQTVDVPGVQPPPPTPPPNNPPTEGIVKPPVTPPITTTSRLQPPPPAPEKHSHLCRGNWAYLCIGLATAAIGGGLCKAHVGGLCVVTDNPPPAIVVPQPAKVGGPGGAPN